MNASLLVSIGSGLLLVASSAGPVGSADPLPPTQVAWERPLLSSGPHVGVIDSEPVPAAEPVLDAAFDECIAAGADVYQLAFAWTDIEVAPGMIDTSFAESLLTTIRAAGRGPRASCPTSGSPRSTRCS